MVLVNISSIWTIIKTISRHLRYKIDRNTESGNFVSVLSVFLMSSVWPLASFLTSLGLSFFNCKIRGAEMMSSRDLSSYTVLWFSDDFPQISTFSRFHCVSITVMPCRRIVTISRTASPWDVEIDDLPSNIPHYVTKSEAAWSFQAGQNCVWTFGYLRVSVFPQMYIEKYMYDRKFRLAFNFWVSHSAIKNKIR